MKKSLFCSVLFSCIASLLWAQAGKINYPDPEFTNEVYYLKKDSAYSLLRLEKASSKMETKAKMGGFGGAEMGYVFDGGRSPVRLSGGNDLSFIISNGTSQAASPSSQSDSMMKANGLDPSMMSGISSMISDPANTIALYKVEPAKGKRKILFQKSGGTFNRKNQPSDKYTFSVRKIREGYWELVVDKALPRGEYAFSMVSMGMGSMNGDALLFAFAID